MINDLPELITDGPILNETGLVHRVLEPAGPGPYPTVVMLHGRSGNEDVMWLFNRLTPVNWLKIAPRGIVSAPHGGFSWLQQEFGAWPSLSAFDTAVDAVYHFLESLPRVYNADPDRIYLMGFSQGAATSFAITMRHPGLVQAIAGLVGFLPGDCRQPLYLEALRELPIFMAVGKNDPLIPYEQTLICAQTLRQADVQLTYHEYNTGHKLNAQGFKDLQAWWAER